MDLPPLVRGIFLKRENRFRVKVEVNGITFAAHLPNSGRLEELLASGREVFLSRKFEGGRKTPFDLKLVRVGELLVSVDARLPRFIFQEALEANRLQEFSGYRVIKSEPRYGESRFDLLLEGPLGLCFVETKSVTLVRDGIALFPDAPTERGKRHLLKLRELASKGTEAVIVFIIQREDALSFSPNFSADPLFARAFWDAIDAGVQAFAYTCLVTEKTIGLKGKIPIATEGTQLLRP